MPRPPATGGITSPYGPRKGSEIGPGVGAFHYGEDRNGDGNYAPDSGQIVLAGYAGSFGNAILVRNGNVVWNLAHHASLNGRRVGQWVTEGDFLAPMGATGLAFGRHVHTERRTGGANAIQSGAHANPGLFYTNPAGGGSQPFDEWEQFMSTNQIKLDQIHAALVQPTPDGGAYYKTDAMIGIMRSELGAAIAAIAAGGISYPGAPYNAFTSIINELRTGRGEEPIDFDEDALAESIVEAIAPLIVEKTGQLSDSSIQRMVNALLAEQAARLAPKE